MLPAASIFKAYDIRGLSPSQIDGEVARRVGRAFIDYLGARRIAVGHDMRASSPEIAEGFIRGVRSQGTAVLDVGTVGTDMLYFAVARENLEGGAIITASHNPKEWNGIKMVRRGAEALSGDAGIKEIKEWVLAGRYADDPGDVGPPVEKKDIREAYARHCLSFVDVAGLPKIKVVLDAGNGMGSVGAETLIKQKPLQLVKIYF